MTQQTYPNRLVLVYGTLKKDYERFSSLAPISEKGPMWLKNHVMMHKGNYPAIVPFEGYDTLGEVYEVPAERMATLDAIEGVSADLYRRKQVPTPWGAAEVYYMPENRLRAGVNIIPSGVWVGATSYTQRWLGDDHEKHALMRHASPSRILSTRHVDGRLDMLAMISLRRQAGLYHDERPSVIYLPPPIDRTAHTAPVAPQYPVIDIEGSVGPGFEEA